jgi:predicted site-specific integrase-resolvase
MDNKPYTQRQLAEHWGITIRTLERWRIQGIGLLFLKIVGRVRYRQEDVAEFEQQHLHHSTSLKVITDRS